MLGIPLGLLTANAVEWGMHKYVLHGMGKKRGTFWAFHFHEHHREVREHGYYDPNYERFPLGMHAQGKEAWALIASAVAVAPLFPVAPFFVGTLWYSSLNYYRVHKKSHMNPAWGEQRVPWHFDHHMGNNPGASPARGLITSWAPGCLPKVGCVKTMCWVLNKFRPGLNVCCPSPNHWAPSHQNRQHGAQRKPVT
jgi:hypothetical protein